MKSLYNERIEQPEAQKRKATMRIMLQRVGFVMKAGVVYRGGPML